MSFPVSIPSLPNPTSGDKLNNPDHAGLHVLENTEIEAIEAKLGIGASTPSGAALLIAGTNSSTAWGNLSGDISSVGALTTLANTGVTPGTYTNANITVDSKGRLTLAATGSGGGGGSSGTVTAVTVVSANGFNGSVATPFTTPAITLSTTITGLLKGNATAISAATAGTDYSAGTSGLATGIIKSTTSTGALSIAVAGDFPTLNQNTTGSAATLTTGRTIQTNLATTAAATFNGSANITPGVTGTLPVANGGTGSTTASALAITVGNLLMPIGFLFTTTTSTNPGTALGFGTWATYGAGRVMVGAGTSDQAFTAGATGGESNHTLTTAEMPSHSHNATLIGSDYGTNTSPHYIGSGSGINQLVISTNSQGGGGSHNNLQPYVVVYIWQRTA